MAELWNKFEAFLESFQISHPMGYRDQNLLLNYSHPWFPIVSVVVYVFLVFTLPKLLKNLPPLKLKLFVALWNLGLSLFSFCVVIGVGEPYLQVYLNNNIYDAFMGKENLYFIGPHRMLCWIYYFALSKFVELFDTLWLLLRKKNPPFLHWYHHATVLLYTWFAAYYHTVLGFNFVIVNAFVHTIMYFYYFLSEIGFRPPQLVALCITLIQISQMVVGIAVVGTSGYFWWATGEPFLSDQPEFVMIAGIVMYGSYLFLFCQFFVGRYLGKKQARPSKSTPVKKTQ